MNRHIFGDRLLLLASALIGKPFFSRSIETAPFGVHVEAAGIHCDPITGVGDYPVTATTLAGMLHAAFRVLHWHGPDRPVIIWHQGGAEKPFDGIIRAAYPPGEAAGCNVIAVKAACQDSLKQQNEAFADLNTYVAMTALCVALTEHLIRSPALRDAPFKLVAGYSLGGFVSNRHHLLFDTADAYVPFVAGTMHGEIFLTTIRSSRLARKNPRVIREALNFDTDWARRQRPNVFPMLGRYDQLNRLEVQGSSYGEVPLDIWEGGHLCGAFDPARVRRKLDNHLPPVAHGGLSDG